MDINKYLTTKVRVVNQYLQKNLPSPKNEPPEIYRAMRYSVFAGGKRIRPILTIATAELLNGNIHRVLPTACAIELIHTYSLIHDDLPCMDDDDFRRGIPTNHKKFGEANAILAGNALLMLAFELISKSKKEYNINELIISKIVNELAHASGFAGMVGGQIVDVESENKTVDQETINYIHTHKTGALICGSVRVGAIISGALSTPLNRLTKFGNTLGLMFQITDDILDELDNRTQLKKVGKRDQARGKATYPSIFGLEKSKKRVTELLSDGNNYLKQFGKKAEPLLAIANLVANRIN
ncbi:MAG: polyprenyl synthetase family protein [bacterium]|nr:polyprenyl synthetase family protein [bacterium]